MALLSRLDSLLPNFTHCSVVWSPEDLGTLSGRVHTGGYLVLVVPGGLGHIGRHSGLVCAVRAHWDVWLDQWSMCLCFVADSCFVFLPDACSREGGSVPLLFLLQPL